MSLRATTGKPGRNMADLPPSCRDAGQASEKSSENFSSLGDQGRASLPPVVPPALPTGAALAAPAFSSPVLAGSESCSASNPLTGSRLGDGSPALSSSDDEVPPAYPVIGLHECAACLGTRRITVLGPGLVVCPVCKDRVSSPSGLGEVIEPDSSDSSLTSLPAGGLSGASAAPAFFIAESDIPF
jgi:hypothetical protein